MPEVFCYYIFFIFNTKQKTSINRTQQTKCRRLRPDALSFPVFESFNIYFQRLQQQLWQHSLISYVSMPEVFCSIYIFFYFQYLTKNINKQNTKLNARVYVLIRCRFHLRPIPVFFIFNTKQNINKQNTKPKCRHLRPDALSFSPSTSCAWDSMRFGILRNTQQHEPCGTRPAPVLHIIYTQHRLMSPPLGGIGNVEATNNENEFRRS